MLRALGALIHLTLTALLIFITTPFVVYADESAAQPTFLLQGQSAQAFLTPDASVEISVTFPKEVRTTRLYICPVGEVVCDGSSYIKRFDINATSTSFTRSWTGDISGGGIADNGTYTVAVRFFDYDVLSSAIEVLSPYSIILPASPTLSSLSSGTRGITDGDTLYRSDFEHATQTWVYDFLWTGENTEHLQGRFFFMRGEFGALEGAAYATHTWGSGSQQIGLYIPTPTLALPGVASGTYTAFVAETNNPEAVIEWFESGGVSGAAPKRYSNFLTFTYIAEDVVEEYDVIVSLAQGDISIAPNENVAVGTPFVPSGVYYFSFSWPHAVSIEHGLFSVLHHDNALAHTVHG